MHLAPFPDAPLSPDVILSTAGGNWFAPSTANVAAGVQFGVGNTSLTGSYVTPAAPTVTVLSVVNLGGTLYEVTFSENFNSFGPFQIQANWFMFDPGTNSWSQASSQTQTGPNTATYSNGAGSATCSQFFVGGEPTGSSFNHLQHTGSTYAVT